MRGPVALSLAVAAAAVPPLASSAAPAHRKPLPPAAPLADFVPLETFANQETFLEVRAGKAGPAGEREISVLTVGTSFEDASYARLARYSVSCDLGTYRAQPGWIAYDKPGSPSPRPPEARDLAPQFPHPRTVLGRAVAAACAPPPTPAPQTFTLVQAFAKAAADTAGKMPPLMVPPVERRGARAPFAGADRADSKYGLVVATAGAKGFLDWASLQRSGSYASVVTATVLTPNPDPDALVVVQRVVGVDCAAKSLVVQQRIGWTLRGSLVFDETPDQVSKTPAPATLDGGLLGAACGGAAPTETFPTLAAAVGR